MKEVDLEIEEDEEDLEADGLAHEMEEVQGLEEDIEADIKKT